MRVIGGKFEEVSVNEEEEDSYGTIWVVSNGQNVKAVTIGGSQMMLLEVCRLQEMRTLALRPLLAELSNSCKSHRVYHKTGGLAENPHNASTSVCVAIASLKRARHAKKVIDSISAFPRSSIPSESFI